MFIILPPASCPGSAGRRRRRLQSGRTCEHMFCISVVTHSSLNLSNVLLDLNPCTEFSTEV